MDGTYVDVGFTKWWDVMITSSTFVEFLAIFLTKK
jgi:hypothetical protein